MWRPLNLLLPSVLFILRFHLQSIHACCCTSNYNSRTKRNETKPNDLISCTITTSYIMAGVYLHFVHLFKTQPYLATSYKSSELPLPGHWTRSRTLQKRLFLRLCPIFRISNWKCTSLVLSPCICLRTFCHFWNIGNGLLSTLILYASALLFRLSCSNVWFEYFGVDNEHSSKYTKRK